MKGSVENPRGSVEKRSPKESVQGADNVLRGSGGLPRDFSRANPRLQNRGGTAPEIFISCSDYHEVYWQMKIVFTLYYSTV